LCSLHGNSFGMYLYTLYWWRTIILFEYRAYASIALYVLSLGPSIIPSSPLGYELFGCLGVWICIIVPNGMMCCLVRSSFLFSICIVGVVLSCFDGRLFMCCTAALYTSPCILELEVGRMVSMPVLCVLCLLLCGCVFLPAVHVGVAVCA
jgi:hypothetical protein